VTALFLSRARLRRDVPAVALARILVPEDATARVDASHRLIWALFSDSPDRERDFLWREEEPGRFMLLSARPPTDAHELFDLESKPFEPALSSGDRLGFTLRANPVVARSAGPGLRGKRHDVVMDLLRREPRCRRAEARAAAVVAAGRAWLARQGASHGFSPRGDEAVDGYERVQIPRSTGNKAALVFGRVDISGVIEVREPDRFLSALARGFGRARAHGCGLMLIRRAP
jgi:CRISPR system Cascade subunit CasE